MTGDKSIPWKLFWVEYRSMFSVRALEKVEAAQAVTLGQASATDGKSAKVKREFLKVMKVAFPEEYGEVK